MSTRLVWQGGSHEFHFRIGELRALQDETDSGPAEVLARLNSGFWRVDDILCTLRLGLVGAGMADGEARKIVDRTFEEANLYSMAMTACAALTARLVGNPDAGSEDEPGKPQGESPAGGTLVSSTDGAA